MVAALSVPPCPALRVVASAAPEPLAWADAQIRALIDRLPAEMREEVTALGRPTNIVRCQHRTTCRTPLVLLFRGGVRIILHPVSLLARDDEATVWCPTCGTPRRFRQER